MQLILKKLFATPVEHLRKLLQWLLNVLADPPPQHTHTHSPYALSLLPVTSNRSAGKRDIRRGREVVEGRLRNREMRGRVRRWVDGVCEKERRRERGW